MYFSFFPRGTYDLKGDGVEKLVTNLMVRVKVRSKVINESSLYDLYDVPEGDTPEITETIVRNKMLDNIINKKETGVSELLIWYKGL